MSRGVLAALAAMTLAIAGCGGGDDEGDASSAAPETTAAETTAAETTETTADVAETTAEEPPAESGGATEPTPAGTTLKIGEAAVIAYKDTGGSGKKSLISVTPTAIEKGTIDDFKNIELDKAQKASTPYYVQLKVENVGKGDLSGTEPGSYIDAVDDRGQEQSELIFFGDFERCNEADPKSFKPGETYETCLAYLIPGGGSIEGMRWIMYDTKTNKSNIDWEQ
jgi:hypothetical protein